MRSDFNAAIPYSFELEPKRYKNCDSYGLFLKLIENLIETYPQCADFIDGVLVAPPGATSQEADVFAHEYVLSELGVQPDLSATICAGGATYGLMVRKAVETIGATDLDAILCIGAGKFPNVSEAGKSLVESASDSQFELPFGTSVPAHFALFAQKYMKENGLSKKDLSYVSVSQRKWALKHPEALMNDQGKLSVDQVLESTPISEPFHRLHCSVPTEGGSAFLVTSAQLARSLADRPAYLHGVGEYHGHAHTFQAKSFSTTGASKSGKKAFEMAGIPPKFIDLAMIYDSFVSCPPMILEDLGLVGKGDSLTWYKKGEMDPGGDLPVNTNGGLTSFGHTGDTSGGSVLHEAVTQVRRKATNRQVEGLRFALAHLMGGMFSAHVTIILGREPFHYG